MLYRSKRKTDITDFKNNRNGGTIEERKDEGAPVQRRKKEVAIISTRVEDSVKRDADKIASEIGIPLSTAVNIFIKRFVANQGFPFSVVAPASVQSVPIMDAGQLEMSIKKAIADPDNTCIPHRFTYLDPVSNEPIVINNRRE